LITRPGDEAAEVARRPSSVGLGLACVAPVLGLLLYAISKGLPVAAATAERANPKLPVAALGRELFENSVPAVLAVAVLLTAVLIGAALFAREPSSKPEPPANR